MGEWREAYQDGCGCVGRYAARLARVHARVRERTSTSRILASSISADDFAAGAYRAAAPGPDQKRGTAKVRERPAQTPQHKEGFEKGMT